MSCRRPSVAVTSVRSLLHYAVRIGLDPHDLLHRSGIDAEATNDLDARIPVTTMVELIELMMANGSDEAYALHAAEDLPYGDLGTVEFLAANAATVGEAFQRLGRYFQMLTDMCRLGYEEHGNSAWVTLDMAVANTAAERFAVEFTFGRATAQMRHLTDGFFLRELRVHYPMPAHKGEYDRLFDCEVSFDRSSNVMVFDLDMAHRRLSNADPRLFRILEKFCDGEIVGLPAIGAVPSEIQSILLQAYSRGETASLATVAKRLGMGSRTLQRRLAESGLSFSDVRERIRRDLAGLWLRQPNLAIAEVAFLLGFSEPSTFHRAFRRWTGMTPRAFRNQPNRN